MNFLQNPRTLALATLTLGMAVTGLGIAWQLHENQKQAVDGFSLLCGHVTAQIRSRMATDEYGLRGARGAFVAAGSGRAGREYFHDYSATQDILREFPGARGFGIIRRVPSVDEASFVATARRDGWPEFGIHQFEPHDGERYVVQYIEPKQQDGVTVGVDIASEGNLRAAALASMRSGKATLSAPIASGQSFGAGARSFLLLLPIFRAGASIATPSERESAALGWSFALLAMDDILSGLDADDQYTLTLSDSAAKDTGPFFTNRNGDPAEVAALRKRISIPIYGRDWEAQIEATPAFLHRMGQPAPSHFALSGLIASLMLGLLAYLFARRSVGKRSVFLEQQRRAAIVEGSTDAIIGETLQGVITYWNRGAERLFGYSAEYAVGKMAGDLLLPAGREGEDFEICEAIGRGAWVPPFETTRQRCDGTLIETSVAASPIYGNDRR